MNLETYVRSNYKSVAEAARRFGISRQYLYALFNGTTTPRPRTARRIERVTNGAIRAAKLLGV
jgi:DNA-binding transcriptional regulator YdaS (Cro superfamily)